MRSPRTSSTRTAPPDPGFRSVHRVDAAGCIGSLPMHVREWGRRDDVPLLFWHALGPEASGNDLADVAPAIAEAGFHVLAVDGPGFGRSAAIDAQRYRLESLVDLLHEL